MVTMEELITVVRCYGDHRANASWFEALDNDNASDQSFTKSKQELEKLQGHLQVIWELAEERAVVLRSYRDLLLRVQGPDAMDRWKAAGSLQRDHARRIQGEYDAVLTPEGIQEIERLNRRLSYQEELGSVGQAPDDAISYSASSDVTSLEVSTYPEKCHG